MSTTRRQFLGAAAALAAARSAFTRSRGETAQETAGSPPTPRNEYDLDPGITYLNHASIGTIPRAVRSLHAEYLRVCETNPWLHVWGGAWSEALEAVHARAAGALGVEADTVAVVRNTTAAFGAAANGLPVRRDGEVLFSSLNHVGASASWEAAAEARGYTVRRFPFPEEDVRTLTSDDVVALHVDAVGDRTDVLVLPHVDNVLGVRHDVARIAEGARARGVRWVCVDAAQSVGMIAVDASGLGADLVATSAHKWWQAPKGTGVMALSAAAIDAMRPMVVTWGRERARGTARSFSDFGTRDLPGLLALDDALEHHARTEGREAHHRRMRAAVRERVDARARLEWRSPDDYADGAALVAIGVKGASAGDLARSLFEEHGVVVRGFGGGGRNHLRLSPNTANTEADLDRCFHALDELLGS